MKKSKIGAILSFFLIYFGLTIENGLAQMQTEADKKVSRTSFPFKDGDRVVFLGNSLIENDLRYGYLELALTTRWPFNDITFRNLGWSGDTVFGEARTYITEPTRYNLLVKQLRESRPTVVFIAYGSNEAFEGAKGLTNFMQGLNKLLDQIDLLGARAVLLSTAPMISSVAEQTQLDRKMMLQLYNDAISKIAVERRIKFIDVFTPLLEFNGNTHLSDNGMNLNENGYYVLATRIQAGLGLSSPAKRSLTIDANSTSITGIGRANIVELKECNEGLDFQVDEAYVPLPLPKGDAIFNDNGLTLQIDGLKNGNYTLTSGGLELLTASAQEWADGMQIKQENTLDQAQKLQDNILKKNELFFHQYRPMNRTYIVGFRSHEQGRHAEGLEDLSKTIAELEKQIALNRIPNPQMYQLRPTR